MLTMKGALWIFKQLFNLKNASASMEFLLLSY